MPKGLICAIIFLKHSRSEGSPGFKTRPLSFIEYVDGREFHHSRIHLLRALAGAYTPAFV
jgi:hypothetical protein